MKIKVGDKVKLNNDEVAFRRINLHIQLMGEIVTIKRITESSWPYKISDDGGRAWEFDDSVIEKVISNKITNWRERIK